MSQDTALSKIVESLTESLERTRTLAEAESRVGSLAALGLITAVEKALVDLAAVRMDALLAEMASLPPVAGGCDDFEEVSAEFLRDPTSWPDDSDPIYFNPPHPFDYADPAEWPVWTDADSWSPTFDGPTPDEVLCRDMAAAWEPSDEDWFDYLAHRDFPMSEADQIALHGCC